MASPIFFAFLLKCRSCSPRAQRVVFDHRLSDYQTWMPIFKRTQSDYKQAYLPNWAIPVTPLWRKLN
jgi:hypothetical protein